MESPTVHEKALLYRSSDEIEDKFLAPSKRLKQNDVAVKEEKASEEDQAAKKLLEEYGVPRDSHAQLLPLLSQWGSRTDQVFKLWELLRQTGEATSLPAVQVWGPPGTGKTAVLGGFLQALGIRHVTVKCACVCSQGELHSRIVQLVSRLVGADLPNKAATAVPAAKRLKRTESNTSDAATSVPGSHPPLGRQLRALDRLEAALKPSLDYAFNSGWKKIVIVLDQIEDIPRRLGGSGVLELLLRLPEVLGRGDLLSIVTVGQMPLSSFGLLNNRETPQVVFGRYTQEEAEEILIRKLSAKAKECGVAKDLQTIVCSGIRKFAVPLLGLNLASLLEVAIDVIQALRPGDRILNMALLQKLVEEASQRLIAFVHLKDAVGDDDPKNTQFAVANETVRNMTRAECRLILSAYLCSRIDKQEDRQLFLPEGASKRGRRQTNSARKKEKAESDFPAPVQAPQPVPLTRMLAICHRLARQPHLVGTDLYQHLAGLREAGFLRFVGGDKGLKLDREPKVICRVELPLARACAVELGVDMAEYLCR
eukprot:TRINITY_DN66224_c0_g1_i1.p1 TRINITY_DN66224_c0_g1~~TRINITY_DN66224_c0_g1_i1.p1  ORF type:complete len:538 (+),score=108.83 TRINITY_DN66224_c0_g1_i1:79-1692(+)